jgi:hypothetical protein
MLDLIRPWSVAACVLLLGALGGCEDRPSVPPHVVEQVRQNQQQPDPHQLLHGPRKRLTLTPVPISLEVPASWDLEKLGTITLVRGPTPSGEAMLQPLTRPTLTGEQVEMLINAARRDRAQDPHRNPFAELRQLGSARVLERQILDAPQPRKILDEQGETRSVTRTPLRWYVQVFVPQGNDAMVYELNILNIDFEQYPQDEELLRQIIASMQIEG